jgi:hypothetical protein
LVLLKQRAETGFAAGSRAAVGGSESNNSLVAAQGRISREAFGRSSAKRLLVAPQSRIVWEAVVTRTEGISVRVIRMLSQLVGFARVEHAGVKFDVCFYTLKIFCKEVAWEYTKIKFFVY